MVFPATVEDNIYELFLGPTLAWTDISSKVYVRDGINLTRGHTSEKTSNQAASPQQLSFTLNNRDGRFSRRNPTGPYYGVLGQNVPVRLSTRTAKDSFDNRTASNGWSTAEVGGAWSTIGTAGDFAVAGGKGTHTISAASTARVSYLGAYTYRNVEVRATCSTGIADVTGGSLGPLNLVIGGLSSTDYFILNVVISTAEVITVDIVHVTNGSVTSGAVTLSFANTGQTLAAAFQLDGQTLRGKVWEASGVEPYDWTIEANISEASSTYINRAGGWVGVRSATGTGNTNTPVTFSYDNFDVRILRFHGEASSWPSEWDTSGNDVYVKLQCTGIRRRLSKGSKPVKSPLTRIFSETALTNPLTGALARPLLYFPVEESAGATSIAPGLTTHGPMVLSGPGTPQFAADSSFPGTLPIGKPNNSRWTAPPVIGAANTGAVTCVFLLSIPNTGEDDFATFAQIGLSGTVGFVDVFYRSTGNGEIWLNFYNQGRTLISSSGTGFVGPGTGVNGIPFLLAVSLAEDGADIDWRIDGVTLPGTAGFSGFTSGALLGTLAGQSVDITRSLLMSPYTQVSHSAIGQVALYNSVVIPFPSLIPALVAYSGFETAGGPSSSRFERICSESGNVTNSYVRGATPAYTTLGRMPQGTMLSILDDTVKADLGVLEESRYINSFNIRLGRSMYNQTVALTLDYATGQVQPSFGETDDDLLLVNDFTAKNPNGSQSRFIQTTGPYSVNLPVTGQGVGTVDDVQEYNVYADSQLPDIASWQVHVGTNDSGRYPKVKVDLAKLAQTNYQLYIDCLSVDLNERIQIINPKDVIINGTISQLARGYSESIGGKTHTITFVCAPADPYTVAEVGDTSGGATDPEIFRVDTDGAIVTQDVSFVGANAGVSGNNATLSPTIHASAAAGDLMVICAGIRTGNPNTPAGWTLLSNAGNCRLFGKVHSGSESTPSVTFTGGAAGDDTIAQLAVFRGVGLSTTRVEAHTSNGSQQNITYLPFTQYAGASLAIVYGFKNDDWTSVSTLGFMTEIGETVSTVGNDAGLVWDYKISQDDFVKVATGIQVTGGAAATGVSGTIVIPAVDVSAAATSLKVYTPSGPLWTTAASDYPMDLNVGGLKVTASACTGSGTTQTFTVSALAAGRTLGTSVSLWHPPVLAQ